MEHNKLWKEKSWDFDSFYTLISKIHLMWMDSLYNVNYILFILR